MYPEAKSVGNWLRHGWHVPVAYVAGFAVMAAVVGWHPDIPAVSAPTSAPDLHRMIAPGEAH